MTTTMEKRYVLPRVNIFEDEDKVTIQAEMPGVSKTGTEVTVRDGELVLKGHRDAPSNGNGGATLLTERPNADYQRSFVLGRSVDTGKIQAAMADGVLTLTLTKAEHVKPRAISIN